MPVFASLFGLLLLQEAWKPHPVGAKILVDFPSVPKVLTKKDKNYVPGATLWSSVHPNRTVLIASFAPLGKGDPTDPHEVLAQAMAGVYDEGKNTIIAQRDVLFDGWPGVEYRVRTPNGLRQIGRTFAVGKAVVTLNATSLVPKDLDATSAAYFATLRLAPGGVRGPLKTAAPTYKAYPLASTGVTVSFPRPPVEQVWELSGEPKRLMHTLISQHVNRGYIAGYVDLSKAEFETMTKEDRDERVAALSRELVRAMRGQPVRTARAKLGTTDVLRTTFAAGEGSAVVRSEVFISGRRIVALIAVVPIYLEKTPDAERFFASAKFE